MMWFALALLFGTVLCDVGGQVCFKLGVGHETEPLPAMGVPSFVAGLVGSPWIVAALSYCGVVIASRFVLGEHISKRRWLATLAVAVGVTLVCWPVP